MRTAPRLPALATILMIGMLVIVATRSRVSGADIARSHYLFPAPGAANVCPDTPLKITFAGPVSLGASGKIQVFDADTKAVIETIDVATPVATQPIGGLADFRYYPVTFQDNHAEIHLHNGALAYGKNYYVTIDPGFFKIAPLGDAAASGDAAAVGLSNTAINNPEDWKFSTKPAPPAAGSTKLTVAADGSGDFCTVQAAVDSLPAGNKTPTEIFIRNGIYREMVYFAQKNAISFIGEDRKKTILEYANNAKFNSAPGTYRRMVFQADHADDIKISNLTIRNTTPQGGTQAEAIILNGTPGSRAIISDVDLYSYQDTLQINGQAYVSNCYIEGDVDFMWGKGPCFFESCECKALRSKAYFSQIRNPATNHGYVYHHCIFDGADGFTGNVLSRIDPARFPSSEVVLIDCTMTNAVGDVGWQLDSKADASNVHFWEFNSHDADGKPVDVSKRLPISKQLKQPDDAATIANFSDPTWVLGNDWKPLADLPVLKADARAAASARTDPVPVKVVSAATTIPDPPKLPVIPAKTFNVADNGAAGDGVTDNTAAIQRTIAAARAAGGGIVEIPAAAKAYLSGPLMLGSKIRLQIDAGATLQMLPLVATGSIPAYPLAGNSYANFISASNAGDIAITGGGTIDGQGAAWWKAYLAAPASMPHRPYLIRLNACDRVQVSGVKLLDSPMFHLAMTGNDLTVQEITIRAPSNAPNTDGIDPGGQHVLIQNCDVSVGDDNVAVKAGGIFCSDITVADCTFGSGHGVSVGGQTNRGLDGMIVKNCTFTGTTTGLRLKADATQGGVVQNITYQNLTMTNVAYPFVFYSYYRDIGNPGTVGKNQSTPEKVNQWNAAPPDALAGDRLPVWKNITIDGLTSTGSTGYCTIWGLPLADELVANLTMHDVSITGGAGLEIYNAKNIQFTGNTTIADPLTCNALVITRQPMDEAIRLGETAMFTVGASGASGARKTPPTVQWNLDGAPLADGARPDGAVITGATTATLKIVNAQAAEAGSYSANIANALDVFDVKAAAIAPDKSPVSARSASAMLTISK
jgi:pectin methylesterase-like acyl-CoA thioesterase